MVRSKLENNTYSFPSGGNGVIRGSLLSLLLSLLIGTSIFLNELLKTNQIRVSGVSATSINYGISQQPITDINQLMPKPCQNQSVICEGSFCIPGVKKCVCDLRMPVQISQFCLRQIDIDTKCFATQQCNHTVREAVCLDVNTRALLDAESSKYKLEQWHQLNELKKLSQSTLSKDRLASSPILSSSNQQNSRRLRQQRQHQHQQHKMLNKIHQTSDLIFLVDNNNNNNNNIYQQSLREAQDSVIPVASARNSPYEINYDTPELLHQNHTRRRTNNSNDRMEFNSFLNLAGAGAGAGSGSGLPQSRSEYTQTSGDLGASSSLTTAPTALPQTTTQSEVPIPSTSPTVAATTTTTTTTPPPPTTTTSQAYTTTTTVASTVSGRSDEKANTYGDSINRKKITMKTTSWPPGVCSCPVGFMFDPMLRKCLALSLADSHCLVDTDCKQIASSHCSVQSRKCECDEPFVWNQQELSCTRPKQSTVRTETGLTATSGDGDAVVGGSGGDQRLTTASTGSLMDNLLPPLVLAKLMPDHTMMLVIFVVLIIIGTLLLLKIIVKCFSSSNSSALISPKSSKKKKTLNQNANLPNRSPYTTPRRPADHHKPASSQLSNFTQVTRGRILNYDFEQESPRGAEPTRSSPISPAMLASATLRPSKQVDRSSSNQDSSVGKQYSATLRSTPRGHKHHAKDHERSAARSTPKSVKKEDSIDDTPIDLNDNISISHLESESKSESSNIVIPGPPPTQQPPYMLKNPMRGQSSAIAAAAAAVANKRLQKKNLEQQQQQQQQQSSNGGRITSESPVFL